MYNKLEVNIPRHFVPIVPKLTKYICIILNVYYRLLLYIWWVRDARGLQRINVQYLTNLVDVNTLWDKMNFWGYTACWKNQMNQNVNVHTHSCLTRVHFTIQWLLCNSFSVCTWKTFLMWFISLIPNRNI